MHKNSDKTLLNSKGSAAKILDIFIVANLAFLALDVFIAHSVNAFAHPAEWIPFYFALGASLLLAIVRLGRTRIWKNYCCFTIGASAIGIGVSGMFFHLGSEFFSDLTLKNIVYTAPFVAPLAFTGIGLLLIMNRMISDKDLEWSQWIVFIAWVGWCGNFILSVFDHAQNGFFNPSEWIPVFASAFAVGCLGTLFFISPEPLFFRFCIIVLVINFIVGVLGFFLHLTTDLQAPGITQIDKFLYGAPILAPLLFPNLSILAGLGIWSMFSKVVVKE
ncbi:hypothetical protein JT359_07360 [Candidatus Poribacteria bacterium]|nr:hypothetical protein [Candidatus Poribacteria bacterium]